MGRKRIFHEESYYARNKERLRAYSKQWKQNNPDKVKAHARKGSYANYLLLKQRYEKRKQELINSLGGCCFDCKQVYPLAVYDFHHTDPTKKDKNPARILKGSMIKAMKELEGCIVLCANCHRIRHHGL